MPDTTKDDTYTGALTGAVIIVITTNSISLYNAIELLVLIFVTFQKWGGFYFWSLLIASFGSIPYAVGYLFSFFHLTSFPVGLAINNFGWWTMVTGQSFVLYSRLHLVMNDRRILRAVLAMIIVDAIIFHIPTTTLNFYSDYGAHPIIAAAGYKVYEKIQMTGFCIQELVISGIYMWKTAQLLRIIATPDARRTMWQLFAINLIIIILDLGLLTIEYCNLRIYEQVLKGVVYSVKVKLEYAILGKLVSIVQRGRHTLTDVLHDHDPYGLEPRNKSTASGPIYEKDVATVTTREWSHVEQGGKTVVGSDYDTTQTDRDSEKDLYGEAIRQVSA